MALVRLNDFVAGTVISDSQVDAEFNQLVEALNGVASVDVLHKFNHATAPVLNVNQLGAGLIQRWQQNTVDKSRIANDGLFELLNTAGQFPGSTSLYTNTAVGTSVANTTTETSIFTGVTASAGSTLTIKAGTSRAGTVYRVRLYSIFNTTGSPTVRYRLKLGSVLVADTGAFTAPTGITGLSFIDAHIYFNALGVSGLVRVDFECRIASVIAGLATYTFATGALGEPTVNTTVDQTVDVTMQYGTAAAGNNTQLLTASVTRRR